MAGKKGIKKLQLLATINENIPKEILVDRTIELFGYDPRFLKHSSEKRVVTICPTCKKEIFRRFYSAGKQIICRRCLNGIKSRKSANHRSIRLKQRYKEGSLIHPLKGKPRSEETKRKLSKAHTGKIVSQETRRKLSLAGKGRVCSEETRAKLRSRCGPLSSMYGKPAHHAKKVWYNKTDGSKVCFRSTWEAKVAKYLDNQNILWDYELEAFPVTYTNNGIIKNGTYRPDFKIQNTNQLIEVKGRWLHEAKLKFEAFKLQYPQYNITLINKEGMKERNLL